MLEGDEAHTQGTVIRACPLDGERPFRDLLWHLFPGEISDYVKAGNISINEKYTAMREMGDVEFENFWGLMLLGSICDADGVQLWEPDDEGALDDPDFDQYMTKSRFQKLRKVI
jgi:hypothetical protein